MANQQSAEVPKAPGTQSAGSEISRPLRPPRLCVSAFPSEPDSLRWSGPCHPKPVPSIPHNSASRINISPPLPVLHLRKPETEKRVISLHISENPEPSSERGVRKSRSKSKNRQFSFG